MQVSQLIFPLSSVRLDTDDESHSALEPFRILKAVRGMMLIEKGFRLAGNRCLWDDGRERLELESRGQYVYSASKLGLQRHSYHVQVDIGCIRLRSKEGMSIV